MFWNHFQLQGLNRDEAWYMARIQLYLARKRAVFTALAATPLLATKTTMEMPSGDLVPIRPEPAMMVAAMAL